jgi:hypothetical protein
MKEDVLLVAGVAVAAAMCVWYVAQAVAGIVHLIPTDDTCSSATQCLALALVSRTARSGHGRPSLSVRAS